MSYGSYVDGIFIFLFKLINQEKFIKSLDSLTEFPELQIKKKDADNSVISDVTDIIDTSDISDNKNKPNFLDIINAKNLQEHVITQQPNNEKTDEEIVYENEHDNDIDKIVPPGCVCIEYDKLTKQEIWSYGDNISNNSKGTNVLDEKPVIVFQRLIDLYRVRKHEYINRWGIDEYDKMFMFQNYDYDYFDKLDEDTEKCIKNHYQNAHIMNYNNNYNNNNKKNNNNRK